MNAQELMTENVINCRADDSLAVAAERIAEALTRQVAFARPGQGVETVSRLMAALKVRRIAVVDAGEAVLGVSSSV